jgi:hypothetical protein
MVVIYQALKVITPNIIQGICENVYDNRKNDMNLMEEYRACLCNYV